MTDRQQLVDTALAAVLKKFAPLNLRADELAVTLVDLAGENNFRPPAIAATCRFIPPA